MHINNSNIQDITFVYNVVFVISGSGKSSTMYGTLHCPKSREKGIVLTAVEYLIDKTPTLYASFVEYYDGKWFDLAAEDAAFNQNSKENYQQVKISTVPDIECFISKVIQKRKTKSTNQNRFSSRSHAVLMISTTKQAPNLIFVDMAGNESSEGKENIRETCFINKSLTQLNTVLSFKARRARPHYRDNEFTYFLMPYLSTNKAVVFYHVRKEHLKKDLLAIQDMVQTKQKKQSVFIKST